MKIIKDGRTTVWQLVPDRNKRKKKNETEITPRAASEAVLEEEREEINGDGSN